MSTPFGFESMGTSVVLARLRKMRDEVPKALDRALYQEAQAIFRKSQKIVPVQYGFLRASGVVEMPVNHEVVIGYGGPAAPYAIHVHENPEARHKPGKSYKFLEIPFMEAIGGMEARLAKAIEQDEQKAPPQAAEPPEVSS